MYTGKHGSSVALPVALHSATGKVPLPQSYTLTMSLASSTCNDFDDDDFDDVHDGPRQLQHDGPVWAYTLQADYAMCTRKKASLALQQGCRARLAKLQPCLCQGGPIHVAALRPIPGPQTLLN